MPNHVYNTLHSTNKPHTMELLHNSSKELNGGLAMLLMPRPKEEEDNWYHWNIDNWGTKWGCYDQDVEGDQLHFTTAWGSISDELLDLIGLHFPNFIFEYEEEQGWGGQIIYKNGELFQKEEYDIPNWDCIGETEDGSEVYRLAENYIKPNDCYDSGWYYYQNLEEPVDLSEKVLNVREL